MFPEAIELETYEILRQSVDIDLKSDGVLQPGSYE